MEKNLSKYPKIQKFKVVNKAKKINHYKINNIILLYLLPIHSNILKIKFILHKVTHIHIQTYSII